MAKITKKIKKYGDTWVVTLSSEDRAILGVDLGSLVSIEKYSEKKSEEPNDLDSYN